MAQVKTIAEHITDNFHELLAQPTLKPSPKVNSLFSALVKVAIDHFPASDIEATLTHVEEKVGLGKLRELCAHGESEMEIYWAQRLAEADDASRTLREFPYYENYRDMVRYELDLLKKYQPHAQKILLAGSGPLPLTAYFMAIEHGLEIVCLDVDEKANAMAAAWMSRFPALKSVQFITANIETFPGAPEVDAYWICALVMGQTQLEQQRLLDNFQHKVLPHQFAGVRSARGMRCLLYPKINCRNCTALTFKEVFHPDNEIVNSFILLGKMAA